MRRPPVGWTLLAFALVACSEGPTGPSAGGSTGSLYVRRSDGLPGSPAIWVSVDPETGQQTGIVAWLPRTITPVFSRDGRWMAWTDVVYDAETELWQSRVWTQRVGASSSFLVTPPHESDMDPSFSGDGERLVVTRGYDNGFRQLVTLNRDGSGVYPVLQASSRARSAADWSPDGALIAYTRPDTRALFVVKPDGSDPTQISNGVAVVGAPVWSPDGQKLAVELTEDGKPDHLLGIFSRRGELLFRTALHAPSNTRLSWSPDATRVTYCGWEGARLVNPKTGDAVNAPSTSQWSCDFVWRP